MSRKVMITAFFVMLLAGCWSSVVPDGPHGLLDAAKGITAGTTGPHDPYHGFAVLCGIVGSILFFGGIFALLANVAFFQIPVIAKYAVIAIAASIPIIWLSVHFGEFINWGTGAAVLAGVGLLGWYLTHRRAKAAIQSVQPIVDDATPVEKKIITAAQTAVQGTKQLVDSLQEKI